MKSLYQYMCESLIKIPTDLFKYMFNYILTQYVSYIYTFDKDVARSLANEYCIDIDTSFKRQNTEVELTTDLEGLPQKLKDNWRLEFGYLRLVIDWEYKIWGNRPKVNASYEESNEHGLPGYFTINPRNLVDMMSTGYDNKTFKDIISKLKATLFHEISHAVQHNSLKWLDLKQVGKSRVVRDNPNSSKEARRMEYLSSQVEFDPTIKTKINQFQQKYKSQNLQKSLAVFVGATKSETDEPDEFFKILKLTDINKWKKAVKKFYLNYDIDLDKEFLNVV